MGFHAVRSIALIITSILLAGCFGPAPVDQWLVVHSADTNGDFQISDQEFNRVQTLAAEGVYHVDAATEDGYAPGPGDQSGTPHDADNNPADWQIDTTELQAFTTLANAFAYQVDADTPDTFITHSASGDADEDGRTNSAEGFTDADKDGLPAFLDNTDQANNALLTSWQTLERTYYVHIPSTAAKAASMPVVFMLHASDQRASEFRALVRIDELADSESFIVVYPEAYERNWNDGRSVSGIPAYDSNVDDVGFLLEILDQLKRRYNVDATRIYVAGMSNGGMMAQRLALEASDQIAAIAAVAALMPVNQTDLPPPLYSVPAMIIVSEDDPYLPWEGGDVIIDGYNLGTFFSGPQTIAVWANLNGCDADPTGTLLPDVDIFDQCRAFHYVYDNCVPDASVELYRLTGAGHSWPGGPATQLLYSAPVCNDIDATTLIWEFVSQFSRE